MNKLILFSITILLLSFQIKNESSYFSENNVKVVNHIDAHAHSVQCRGMTKKGTQCKNKTNNSNGYCHLHQDQENNTITNNLTSHGESKKQQLSQSVRCSGLTKSGNQCKRMTKNANGRCQDHGNQ